ncbi:MAG: 1,3-beta-galactosyl-N-acetylhexosamine phosphorylase [Lachnospiraceae bacterium]|nr:1,3-beta-galactosyl-N-acetylhexosamine phosphorylase [Lachnospiraceae bacterium]
MSKATNSVGGFTLPGESGYEAYTLKLADIWGADVIRDSDGTVLSDEILQAGYDIYSTLCVIRDHNTWADAHPQYLQSTLLMTDARTATDGPILTIPVMEDFFEEQFTVNDSPEAMKYWQVFDRTTNTALPAKQWHYEPSGRSVVIPEPVPFHRYTVSFFAWRIWEEISMYNHTTNHWNKEHLKQIDPVYPETQEYLSDWLEHWCETHPATNVVRFTSMFYNFVWIWGSDERNRNRYTDWGSYDFTVSPRMLDLFADRYGYALCAEDFINGGKLHVTHMPPTDKQRDYMDFVNDFVIAFGRRLIDIVHRHNKKAYVFYDDSWIGVEPTSPRFREFGFDGLIKCVFSGFEVRLNAGVEVDTHEIRLHPYLFPVGLGGAPTFAPGGNPTQDARRYWSHVRRALLRARIDRIGLGGYLHLLEDYPDFVEYIAGLADEFRAIRSLHEAGAPACLPLKIGVLHAWGKLRPWTLSGHFHETYRHDLIHINEALSGFPLEVEFLDFKEVMTRNLEEFGILLNAGERGTAWSGGDVWADPGLVTKISSYVYHGGVFLGVNCPTALTEDTQDTVFALSNILGVDLDIPARTCHGALCFETRPEEALFPADSHIPLHASVHLTDSCARVLASLDGTPTLVINEFGKGKGVYLSGFETTLANNRMLLNLMLYAAGISADQSELLTDNPHVETAYFPDAGTLVVINNADTPQSATVSLSNGDRVRTDIPACGSLFLSD